MTLIATTSSHRNPLRAFAALFFLDILSLIIISLIVVSLVIISISPWEFV
jgi:hypothetical protein